MNCFVGRECKVDCVTLLFYCTFLFLVSLVIILLLYMEFGNAFNFGICGICGIFIGMINI